jgi:uncharacterized membrane protein
VGVDTRPVDPSTPTLPIICPVCGGSNSADAIFCANPACHKALGEFRYVTEEIARETRSHERIADSVTSFIGRPYFLVVHTLWFALWVAINTGFFMIARRFDEYPFSLLGIVLSIEAIFITGFVLISQNRQSAHADKRAELDYEVNVRTFRDIQHIKAVLGRLEDRINKVEKTITNT